METEEILEELLNVETEIEDVQGKTANQALPCNKNVSLSWFLACNNFCGNCVWWVVRSDKRVAGAAREVV